MQVTECQERLPAEDVAVEDARRVRPGQRRRRLVEQAPCVVEERRRLAEASVQQERGATDDRDERVDDGGSLGEQPCPLRHLERARSIPDADAREGRRRDEHRRICRTFGLERRCLREQQPRRGAGVAEVLDLAP